MDIQISYDYRADELKELPIEELASYVLAEEGLPFTTEVSIAFVTDEAIAKLNERFRHKNGPTDVLSFPCDSPSDDLAASLLSQAPTLALGDVVIAPDVADRQREGFGTAFADEIELLLVHGLLHLCDYDHVSPDEAERMETRERELLTGFAASDTAGDNSEQ